MIIFGDYKRLPDLMYAATTSGLRLSGCVAWVRTRPGTGGLFRSSWDPILIASRGTPDAVDRAAARNVIQTDDVEFADDLVVTANYPAKRTHPYRSHPKSSNRSWPASAAAATSSLTRSQGQGLPGWRRRTSTWNLVREGCDVDAAFALDRAL